MYSEYRMYEPGFQLNPLGLPSFLGTLFTGKSSRLCSIPDSLVEILLMVKKTTWLPENNKKIIARKKFHHIKVK